MPNVVVPVAADSVIHATSPRPSPSTSTTRLECAPDGTPPGPVAQPPGVGAVLAGPAAVVVEERVDVVVGPDVVSREGGDVVGAVEVVELTLVVDEALLGPSLQPTAAEDRATSAASHWMILRRHGMRGSLLKR